MSQNNVMLAAVGGLLAGVFLSAAADDDQERLAALDDRVEAVRKTLGDVAEDTRRAEARTQRIADGTEALGPLREDVAGMADRLAAIEAGQDGIATGQERLVATQGALAEELETRLSALETALGEERREIAALASALEEMGGSAADRASVAALGDRIDALGARLDETGEDLGERLAALPRGGEAVPPRARPTPPAEAKAPPAGEEPAPTLAPVRAEALATAIGEDGLVMRFGETRTVGDTRVFLSRMDGDDAVLRVDGEEVALGPDAGPARLANGCRLTLAGMDGRTAYIARECGEAGRAIAAAPTAAEPVAPETSPETPGDRLAAAIGEDGLVMRFGETREVGDARVFLSRMDGGDAVLRVGGEEVALGPDAGTARLANGCALTLAGMDGRTAYIARECDAAGTEVAAAPTSNDAGRDDDATGGGTSSVSLGIGQSAELGAGTRVFLSRVIDGEAVLRVAGGGDVRLDAASGPVRVGGCRVSLAGLDGRTAELRSDC